MVRDVGSQYARGAPGGWASPSSVYPYRRGFRRHTSCMGRHAAHEPEAWFISNQHVGQIHSPVPALSVQLFLATVLRQLSRMLYASTKPAGLNESGSGPHVSYSEVRQHGAPTADRRRSRGTASRLRPCVICVSAEA